MLALYVVKVIGEDLISERGWMQKKKIGGTEFPKHYRDRENNCRISKISIKLASSRHM